MLELQADSWHDIARLGKMAYIVNLPDEFYKYYWNPQQLVGQHVQIDGKPYTVHAVERFMIGCDESMPYKLPCGILVKEFLSPSLHYRTNSKQLDSSTETFHRDTKE